MSWSDTLISEAFTWLKELLRSKQDIHQIESIIKDNIFRFEGVHRVSLVQLTNGGSSLKEEQDIYMTVLFECEDNRYVSKLPTIKNMKVDESMREHIRRVLNRKFSALSTSRIESNTTLGKMLKSYGTTYSESYLLKRSKKKALVLSISTSVRDSNPFDHYKTDIEIQVDRIKQLLK